MKVAIICFDNPFLKPFEGGKRGIKSRIDSLAKITDIDVDVFVLNKRGEGFSSDWPFDNDRGMHMFRQYRMNKVSPLYLLSKYPLCVNKRYVDDCCKDLSNMKYDFVIYEGLQVSKYRFKNIVQSNYHIVYFHDIESKYRSEMAKACRGVKKIANYLESFKFSFLERKSIRYFDRFWFVSSDEMMTFSEKYKSDNCVYIPYPVESSPNPPHTIDGSHKLLYVGDLSLLNNKQSLEWFVRDCLPLIRERDNKVEVIVAGRVDANFKEWLLLKGFSVLGYVDNLNVLYQNTNVILCPVLYGAGVKIKTLDALSQGKLVITTSKGIEGTELIDGTHLVVRDDPIGFASSCVDALNDIHSYEQIINNGFYYVVNEHTSINQARIIENEFKLMLGDTI